MTPDLRASEAPCHDMLATNPPWATSMGDIYWRSYPLPTAEEMRHARAHTKPADVWVQP